MKADAAINLQIGFDIRIFNAMLGRATVWHIPAAKLSGFVRQFVAAARRWRRTSNQEPASSDVIVLLVRLAQLLL